MRKTYRLDIEGKNRDRLIEASKHDIRKYVKRERGRPLPEGVDFWDFDCKFGSDDAGAVEVHFATLMGHIDTVAKEGGGQFYVEVVTRHGHRSSRPQGAENVAASDSQDAK